MEQHNSHHSNCSLNNCHICIVNKYKKRIERTIFVSTKKDDGIFITLYRVMDEYERRNVALIELEEECNHIKNGFQQNDLDSDGNKRSRRNFYKYYLKYTFGSDESEVDLDEIKSGKFDKWSSH